MGFSLLSFISIVKISVLIGLFVLFRKKAKKLSDELEQSTGE